MLILTRCHRPRLPRLRHPAPKRRPSSHPILPHRPPHQIPHLLPRPLSRLLHGASLRLHSPRPQHLVLLHSLHPPCLDLRPLASSASIKTTWRKRRRRNEALHRRMVPAFLVPELSPACLDRAPALPARSQASYSLRCKYPHRAIALPDQENHHHHSLPLLFPSKTPPHQRTNCSNGNGNARRILGSLVYAPETRSGC